MNIEADYAVPNKGIVEALSLLRSGAEYLPAWAIAILFLRSRGHKLTKEAALEATKEWVGNCQLDLVEHQGAPYDHDKIIPSMVQLPIEFAPKIRISGMDVLINLKSAINLADTLYPSSELAWIKTEINEVSNNSGLQNKSIVANCHVDPKPTPGNGNGEEEGRPKERQDYFRSILEKLEKPDNKNVWSELRKSATSEVPVTRVFGNAQLTFKYKDGSIDQITKKTFQNDMAAIRKEK